MRDQIFICHCKQDARWLKALQTHLKPLLRQKPLVIWDETKVMPGKDWRKEIKDAIDTAKVAVLLVSPDFLASDFIAEEQLPSLLNAAEHDGLTILCVAVRPCSYEKMVAIERYKALNDPSKTLSQMKPNQREELLSRICEQIAEIAHQESSENEPEPSPLPLVVNLDGIGITVQGEQIASRERIQQVLESYFDVDACFVRQMELDRLLNVVKPGYSAMIQGPHGVGKTALLKQLRAVCQQEQISYNYLDLGIAEAQLQTTLSRNIVIALTNTDPGPIRPDDVEKHLESAQLVSQAVICLDNIDEFARNPRIAFEHEMLQIRALGTHHASKLKFSVILTSNEGFTMRNYYQTSGSPWFTNYPETRLATLSEMRAIQLLELAGISDDKQVSYCINHIKKQLPLDLLLMAYLLKITSSAGVSNDKLAKDVYLHVEPLLRE